MKLIFKNSYDEERVIATNLQLKQDCYREINKFLSAHNYKSYYYREWSRENRTYVDVGSHTEFFIIDGD